MDKGCSRSSYSLDEWDFISRGMHREGMGVGCSERMRHSYSRVLRG